MVNAQEGLPFCQQPGICCITHEDIHNISDAPAIAIHIIERQGSQEIHSASSITPTNASAPADRDNMTQGTRSRRRAKASRPVAYTLAPVMPARQGYNPNTASTAAEGFPEPDAPYNTSHALRTPRIQRVVLRKRATHPFDRTMPPRSPLYLTAIFV